MSTRPTYAQLREEVLRRYPDGQTPAGISVDDIVQLKIQNTYSTHLDIARSMAGVMRADMAAYDQDHSKFTQSLGCWSGFHAQQMIKSVKRMRGTAKGTYVYLSGWMVAGLRNRFGHQPDQSMHEKTAVADLIEEIYVSLRQADEVALNDLFRELKAARQKGQPQDVIETIIQRIDTFESHVVPIIADIDAGFGNEHATYLLAKEMIKAGACCLQIENQVSDAKQCGHQDGKVTVPREDFIEKLKACRLAGVAVGQGHSAAVTCAGQLLSWGGAEFGQLGHGDPHVVGTEVPTPCSVRHVCYGEGPPTSGGTGGLASALDSAGGEPPPRMPGALSPAQEVRFVQVACGECHTLALAANSAARVVEELSMYSALGSFSRSQPRHWAKACGCE